MLQTPSYHGNTISNNEEEEEEEKKSLNLIKMKTPLGDKDSDSYEEITNQEREIMEYFDAKEILLTQPKEKAYEFL